MAKQPWCAVFLSSFLPGAGQIYAGALWRGVVFIAAFFLVILSFVVALAGFLCTPSPGGAASFLLILPASFIVYACILIFSLFDAHKSARRFNADHQVPPAEKPKKNPWLAVFFSHLFPSVGQFYNGSILKGLAAIVLFFVIALLEEIHWGFAFLFVPYSLLVMKDAFDTAEHKNGSNRRFFQQGTMVAQVLVLTSVTLTAAPIGYYVKTHYVEAFKIPSGAMMPTILIGDHILTDKTIEPYDLRRGDIVVFRYPENRSKNFIKRIIALSGETVEGRGRTVYVNGQPLEEPYAQYLSYDGSPSGEDDNRTFGPVRVPEDAYFVMGDNRNNSMDSRVWGPVPANDMLARALKIYWSWDAAQETVRWKRIGVAFE